MITPFLQWHCLYGKSNLFFLNSLTNSNRLLLGRIFPEAPKNSQYDRVFFRAFNDNFYQIIMITLHHLLCQVIVEL